MSKRVEKKIKEKHKEVSQFTKKENFAFLVNNCVASCGYDGCTKSINFFAFSKELNRYVLFALKSEKNDTICSTVYVLKKSSLKRFYKREDFKILDKKQKVHFVEYMRS